MNAMSAIIHTLDGWVTPYDLDIGCQLRVQHDVAITGGFGGTVLAHITDSVQYGTFMGCEYREFALRRNDIMFFDNRMWMYDGEDWTDINSCHISLVSLVTEECEVPDSDIPFCDFDNILEEEMEAAECL